MAQILQLMVVNQRAGRGGLEDEMPRERERKGERTEIETGNKTEKETDTEQRKKVGVGHE